MCESVQDHGKRIPLRRLQCWSERCEEFILEIILLEITEKSSAKSRRKLLWVRAYVLSSRGAKWTPLADNVMRPSGESSSRNSLSSIHLFAFRQGNGSVGSQKVRSDETMFLPSFAIHSRPGIPPWLRKIQDRGHRTRAYLLIQAKAGKMCARPSRNHR